MLDNYRHIHFIGIGGSGISAIAYLALMRGLKVSGSDSAGSPIIDSLKKAGADITIGHNIDNLNRLAELIVYTEAIDQKSNPEYLEAKKRKIPAMNYFEMLGVISARKKTVAVIGTHGKTTVTAMLGEALVKAGTEPTVILGSTLKSFDNRNINAGQSEWFIVEGCEYRRSFLSLHPFGAVLTSCEAEHLDYYKDEADYVSAFTEFVKKIPEDGFLVYNAENSNCRTVSQHCKGKVIPVDQKTIDEISIKPKVPGDFNRENATYAYLTAKQITNEEDILRKALTEFAGAARRMEIIGEKNGITVISDYAHHPTEIRAVLSALKKEYADKRIICVYQPHQYARTLSIMNDLPDSFGNVDKLIIPSIYAARDSREDKQKINAEKLVNMIAAKHPDIIWGKNFDKTLDLIKAQTRPNDLLLIMGAGDVWEVGERFLK